MINIILNIGEVYFLNETFHNEQHRVYFNQVPHVYMNNLLPYDICIKAGCLKSDFRKI